MRIQELWASGGIWSIDLLIFWFFGLHGAKLNMLKRDVASAWPLQEPRRSHRRTRSLPPQQEDFFSGEEARVVEFNAIFRSWYLDQRKNLFFCVWIKVYETPADSSSEVLWDLCRARRQQRKGPKSGPSFRRRGFDPARRGPWTTLNDERHDGQVSLLSMWFRWSQCTCVMCYVLSMYITQLYTYIQHEYIYIYTNIHSIWIIYIYIYIYSK